MILQQKICRSHVGVDHEPFLSCSSKMSEDKLLILVTFLAHMENLEDESVPLTYLHGKVSKAKSSKIK